MKRSAVMAIAAMIAALMLGAPLAAMSAETSGKAPDLSGVWLPDSKASGRWPQNPPFTPAMAARRAEWTKATAPIDLARDDDHTSCLPYTLTYMMTTITQYPFEIVATPSRIYFLTETYGQVRRIDLTGSPVSPDTLPSRPGTSRGQWDGKQLNVETTHILAEHEGTRFPSSRSLRVQERFSLEENGDAGKRLINEITIIDPLVYVEPVTVRMVYKSARDVVVGEYVCNEDIWDQHRDGASSEIPWR